ncbi:MAG TPA: hypothetical protein VN615_07260 [Gaiellales bacterium]|nr:hypothetical protein [Gaiellales bacterium]
MRHRKLIAATVVAAVLVVAAAAYANTKNSMQPAHVYYGTVVSGQHPDRLITLHNGTGARQTIDTVDISGSGGYVFTLAANTQLLADSGLPRCKPGLVLPARASCSIDVRVHTLRPSWFRSVLSVVYTNGWFNSSELRAHVVAP